MSRLQVDKARIVQPTLAPDNVLLRINWRPLGNKQLLVLIGQILHVLGQSIAAIVDCLCMFVDT